MRRLPTYYYLTHFHEFLQFVQGPCSDLLHPSHEAFLRQFHAASKEQQCMLVRCINRKHAAVKISSLRFEELPNITDLIEQLIQMGWLATPGIKDLNAWIDCLTKDELYSLYQSCAQVDSAKIAKSLPRTQLLKVCLSIEKQAVLRSPQLENYVVRRTDTITDYFLYLYFGNTKARLNQFSLRDLGVMNTRKGHAQMQSRFDCKDAALSSFNLSLYLRELRQAPLNTMLEIESFINAVPKAVGLAAQEKHQQVMIDLACAMLPLDTPRALDILGAIDVEQAQEKWCREAYKHGSVEAVKEKLETMIDMPLSDKSLTFAEDFLARKYKQKRTSLLTDMLREGNQHLSLDETFKGGVERGVVAHYKQKGIAAYRTENTLWRSLFGLMFWQELFEIPGLGLATQFDFMPNCLKQNNFYALADDQIEAKLSQFDEAVQCMSILVKNAAQYHGKGQGIFHWRNDLLESLQLFVSQSPINAIKQQLRRMAQDWQACHDGFPDIMVIEDGRLRFEEIKAEGDTLRRNQLLCIQKLREFGFDVRITTVDFIIDPDQAYVVVDIETTGGRASSHKITEIGMVKLVRGEIVDSWQSLLNPQRRIPANIIALTGIDNDLVRGAPLFADIADEVEAFTQDCIFVAHNVNFDYGFIKEEFARIDRFWRRPKLCTVAQMRRHYKGLPSYSLANLTKHFEIDMQRHHRAMSDALAAGELLNLINEKRFAQQIN